MALDRVVGSIVLLGLLFAACTSPPTEIAGAATSSQATNAVGSTTLPNPPSSNVTVDETTVSGDLAGELTTPGSVVICMTFPVARVAVYDAAGQPTGQSVEFALELARRLNLEPQILDVVFEEIIDAIEAGECDFSLAGHFITPERLERIEMIPYLKGRQQLVVPFGNPEAFDDALDLCGRKVSSRSGTIQEELVLGVGLYQGSGLNDACTDADLSPIDLVTFPGESEAVDALRDGEVVAFLGGTTWVAEYPDELALAPAVDLPEFSNGIGVHKDHPLLGNALRSSLAAMIADGTYLRIHDTWGVGQPITP